MKIEVIKGGRPLDDPRARVFNETPVRSDGKVVLPSPDTIDFWNELRADWNKIGFGVMDLRTFLVNYNPDTNRYGYSVTESGKYRPLWASFIRQDEGQNVQYSALDTFIAREFNPPREVPEFVEAVEEVRGLLEVKEKKPHGWQREILADIPKPEFWQDFSTDLSELSGQPSFRKFLLDFNPRIPSTLRDRFGHVVAGKYRSIYSNFHMGQYFPGTQEALGLDVDLATLSAPERNKVFYNLAPPEVRLQLSGHFPKEFGDHSSEVLKNEGLVSPEAQFVLDSVGSLRGDYRQNVLESLAGYLTATKKNQDGPLVPPIELVGSLERVVTQQTQEETAAPPLTTTEAIRQSINLTPIIERLGSDNSVEAKAAGQLLESLAQYYYFSLVKNDIYKPTALFWTSFQDQHQGEMTPSPEVMQSFLEEQIKNKLAQTEGGLSSTMVDYFTQQIFPIVYQEFADIASYAPKIDYFRKHDEQGKPKHLFLHQVEAIKHLATHQGGILADEPGTGKTVELSLAALNLVDQKDIPEDRPKRVLVVGSTTVINNWEGELDLHIEPDSVDVANISVKEDEEDNLLKDRIARFKRVLDFPSHDKQIGLVHYDIFRNADFQRLLQEYDFDVKIVDEAHNVKSRFLESILNAASEATTGRKVAKRTRGLYDFLRSDPSSAVFIATSTPFVKDLIEPLIMAHLASPELVPADKVKELMKDPVATHRTIRSVMLRRTKEEIADLPPKETSFVPIDLASMSDNEKKKFAELAEKIFEENEGQFARFYSMLALEGQAKYPWLINKVRQLNEEGKKVLIFTPFVSGHDKLTGPISTSAIKSRLKRAGISEVERLDGTLSDHERVEIQKEFRSKDGVKNLVGNYQIAGESITLCSPENRATEVVLFIPPNAISRYIQAVDRVHRFGQNEKVTIHIPFVTNDPLGRDEGTYDERVARRLTQEIARFGSVVDGLFFIESEDFYQSIAKGEFGTADGNISFDVGEKRSPHEPRERSRRQYTRKRQTAPKGRERFRFKNDGNSENGSEVKPRLVITREPKLSAEDPEIVFKSDELAEINSSINLAEQESVNAFLTQIQQYPLLTSDQMRFLFSHLKEGSTLESMRQDEQFPLLFSLEGGTKMDSVFFDSKDIKQVIANCNLRLVANIAKGWYGLPYSDKIQEGVFGLYNAVEKFDPSREVKLDSGEVKQVEFSTYATQWIMQAIRRSIADTALPIRIPVHMHETLNQARRVAESFFSEHDRLPSGNEIRELLLNQGRMSPEQIENLMKLFSRGVTRVGSLDAEMEGESTRSRGGNSRTLGDMVTDMHVDVEEDVAKEIQESEQKRELQRSFQRLSEVQRKVLDLRFGLTNGRRMTLEEVGKEFGVTRERIRQIEAKALIKLRQDPQLKQKRREEIGINTEAADRAPLDRDPRPRTPRSSREVVERAKPVRLQSQLSQEQRGILALVEKGIEQSLLSTRLALIFGVSPEEAQTKITEAIDHAKNIVRPTVENHSNVSLNQAEGERALTTKQMRILDFRVELYVAQSTGITYEQVAADLGYDVADIEKSVDRLFLGGKDVGGSFV